MLPYNAVHSIQQTEQIPNDPPQIGAKSTTTSNHPSTPDAVVVDMVLIDAGKKIMMYVRSWESCVALIEDRQFMERVSTTNDSKGLGSIHGLSDNYFLQSIPFYGTKWLP